MALRTDMLTVINGPEDGAEFSIVRAPFTIGGVDSCFINIRLDSGVFGIQAEGNAVEDGYSIRIMSDAPVYVNGKKVGRYRSKVLRAGQLLKVGATDLMLECAQGGLASRSKGIKPRGDGARLAKSLFFGGYARGAMILTRAYAFIRRLMWAILKRWQFATIAALVLGYFFVPGFRGVLEHWIGMGVEFGKNLIEKINE